MDPVKAGLIQRVEDEFGISVSDGEALKVRTAGDLHLLLMRKLERDDSLHLARALYRTRLVLADALGIPRHSIDPGTRLAELVPPTDRAERWNAIASKSGGQFPRLSHSQRLQDRVMLASMAVASLPVIALWWALYELDWIRGIWALLFAMPAAVAFLLVESRVEKHLLRATARWSTELPCETVQELAQGLAQKHASLPRQGNGRKLSGDDVWMRLAETIRQSGACEHEHIMPGTTIPELEQVR